jgi:hypothetical protein
MSSRKRAPSAGLQETYDSIKGVNFSPALGSHVKEMFAQPPHRLLSQELLTRVKDDKHLPTRVDELHQLAALAEAFTELRRRSKQPWAKMAEFLDREGSSCIPILLKQKTRTI